MLRCARCRTEVDELWATLEMFSRVGNMRAFDLCRPCTQVAYAFVLNRSIKWEDKAMTIIWDLPLNDPEDIDDAEHHAMCHCHDCDPDFRFEYLREERWAG